MNDFTKETIEPMCDKCGGRKSLPMIQGNEACGHYGFPQGIDRRFLHECGISTYQVFADILSESTVSIWSK